MSLSRRIAVDVMGGDFGPAVTVPAAVAVAERQPVNLLLIGDEQQIHPLLEKSAGRAGHIEVLHTPDKLSNLIKPENALRGHRNSSMYLAVEQVQLKQAQACVSAGNSGALMLIARHLLKTIPGIIRPAMLARIPVSGGKCAWLLDVGAHINSSAEELFQFALMGAELAAASLTAVPRVGLLNIGAEEHKGTSEIRGAARLLEQHAAATVAGQASLDYIGFVEGNCIYAGDADVIVCDGFTGNVVIKNSAGVVNLIEARLRETVLRNWRQRLFGLLARPLLQDLREAMDPAAYNGASILGLQGIVVKSHGNASACAFAAAIEQASREAGASIHNRIAAGAAARPYE